MKWGNKLLLALCVNILKMIAFSNMLGIYAEVRLKSIIATMLIENVRKCQSIKYSQWFV